MSSPFLHPRQANVGEVCSVPKTHVSLLLNHQLVSARLMFLIPVRDPILPSPQRLICNADIVGTSWTTSASQLPGQGRALELRIKRAMGFVLGVPDNVMGAAGG